MKLVSTVSLYAGGSGSGCNPAAGKCGRHSSGFTEAPEFDEMHNENVQVLNKLPDKVQVYHGTSNENWYKIRNDGLRAPSNDHLYVTLSKASAAGYGDRVLTFNVSKDELKAIRGTELGEFAIGSGFVKPGRIYRARME